MLEHMCSNQASNGFIVYRFQKADKTVVKRRNNRCNFWVGAASRLHFQMAGSWLHSKSFRCLKYAEDCKPLAFSRLKWQIPMAIICVIVVGRYQMCHGCHRAAASKPSTREPWRDALRWCVNRNFSTEVFEYGYCELRKFRQGCMIFGNATLGVALDDVIVANRVVWKTASW